MSAVFFRLVHGVYTTLTLFILQPREERKGNVFILSPLKEVAKSLVRMETGSYCCHKHYKLARKEKTEKPFQCYSETEDHDMVFCSNTSTAAALTNSRWRPSLPEERLPRKGGPKVVFEKRLRSLLGSNSNREAQTGTLEI